MAISYLPISVFFPFSNKNATASFIIHRARKIFCLKKSAFLFKKYNILSLYDFND